MAPTTRQARRSHANDASQSDELANPEASVLRTPSKGTSRPQDSSTFPKRRGRPPGSKNRPKTITTLSPTKQPRSTRRGRPPGSAMGNLEPPDMPDKQIALALNRGDENPNTNHRVAQASRRVFRYTAQWPWQWAVRFLPRKKWTVPLVEDLAQLLGAIYQKSVNTSTDNGNLEIARRFLYKRAQHRSRFCPQITGGDVIEALRYFEVETRRTLPDVQQTSQTTQPGRVADLVGSDTESQPDEIPTENGVINEGLIATEDECEVSDNDGHSNEHESVISDGNSASSRERMLSPTRISHVEQRSQVNNSQTGQIGQSADRFSSDTTPTTVCPTSASATTIFANLVDAIAPVLVELEARKESLTCDLSILRQSIRDKEDAIKRTVTATVQTEVIDSMRGALRKHEEEREQMQIAKGNFEQSLSTFKMTQDMISYIYQGYNTQIQEWDEIILRTKTEIQHAVEEALRSNKAEIDDLKAALQEDKCQAWRLEGDVKETNDHLKSCRLGTSLGQLGSPGISTLMANLERHGVFLFHMIAEVRTADQPR